MDPMGDLIKYAPQSPTATPAPTNIFPFSSAGGSLIDPSDGGGSCDDGDYVGPDGDGGSAIDGGDYSNFWNGLFNSGVNFQAYYNAYKSGTLGISGFNDNPADYQTPANSPDQANANAAAGVSPGAINSLSGSGGSDPTVYYASASHDLSYIDNANAGGILDGVPNPASWNFTPAGPGGRYQVAGVSGINFTYFYYGENSKGNMEVGFNHAKIKPLYFEYPLIRKTSSGKIYIVPAGMAASIMAASTTAAIEATETAWGRTVPTEGNQEDMYRFFIKTLRISVQAGGGRLTEIPQYGPTPLTPYRTL